MKKEYYPSIPKSALFQRRYIAKRSAHSRGSTVDLTIVPLPLPLYDQIKDELSPKQFDSLRRANS